MAKSSPYPNTGSDHEGTMKKDTCRHVEDPEGPSLDQSGREAGT